MGVIYTGQLARKHDYVNHGLEIVDTTVKSGLAIFAPRWDMVLGHKNGTMSDMEYTQQYRDMMAESFRHNRQQWINFINKSNSIVLCCYCKSGVFCHRHILAGYFIAIASKNDIFIDFKGEFIIDDKQLGLML